MDQPWKSINGLIVSFTTSFDQWKIQFHTEIIKKKKKVTWKLLITIVMEDIPLLNPPVSAYRGGPVDRGYGFESPWSKVLVTLF